MRSKMPKRSFTGLTIDLLADPLQFAAPLPPPASLSDWRYYGVITIDGVSGALAWRQFGHGMGIGGEVRVLGPWEGIAISAAIDVRTPGYEGLPRLVPEPRTDSTTWGGLPPSGV